MSKKIFCITDFDSTNSGYRNICAPLFIELSKLGYEIKVAGLMYRGDEHDYPFSVIPCGTMQEAVAIGNNLMAMWNPDVIVVAMDIPIQANVYSQFAPHKKKYIAITPLENGPLTLSWALPLMNMDKVFFISELGKQEALKAGVKSADHLQIGVDTVSYHPATPEERAKLREGLGIPQDAFVVLTVADNQERKNLWAGMKAISLLKKEIDRPIKYVLVTREQNPYGWKLRDLARDLDIKEEYAVFERGLPQKDLWGLYAVADVYLQPSKAEGLGMPVLDAMACGIPVVATDTGALHELLWGTNSVPRGHLILPEYSFTDVWGNSRRDMINVFHCANVLKEISVGGTSAMESALEYVRSRTWDIPAQQLHNEIERMFNES